MAGRPVGPESERRDGQATLTMDRRMSSAECMSRTRPSP
ncbi:hypothetical protein DVDV_4353 [Desulfovibrio sp. DV]|nr:hypothetical protein DVDV_4353 [Desulfovibrio sp. DV]